jgi:hypothetical protein
MEGDVLFYGFYVTSKLFTCNIFIANDMPVQICRHNVIELPHKSHKSAFRCGHYDDMVTESSC